MVRLILASLILMCLNTKIQAEEPIVSDYDIVFIIVDDLNDWVGAYNQHPNAKTPNIDEFARTSLKFTKAYTAVPLCGSSRAALMLGKAPWITGIYSNWCDFRSVENLQDSQTLPQVLKNEGLDTIAIGKIFHKEGAI